MSTLEIHDTEFTRGGFRDHKCTFSWTLGNCYWCSHPLRATLKSMHAFTLKYANNYIIMLILKAPKTPHKNIIISLIVQCCHL